MAKIFSRFFVRGAMFSILLTVPVALFSQSVSSRQVAGLMEDVNALRAEVQRLRAELEDLRSENARLLDRVQVERNSGAHSSAALASFRVEMNSKFESFRKEMNASTDEKLQKLTNNINAAFADFRKQVNEVLGRENASSGAPSGPIARPKDLPENAIRYKVKPGDTLSKIAAANGSKIVWIQFINEGLNPNKIRVGMEILVPVKE